MKVERIVIHRVRLPLVTTFATSLGVLAEKDAVLVEAESEGFTGWGEVAAWADPWYSYETVETSMYVLSTYLAPALLGHHAEENPTEIDRVRGYPMAKAAVETARLDLLARSAGTALAQWLGDSSQETIPVGISLGIEDEVKHLLDRIHAAVAHGYQRIKIKIQPAWDVDVVRAIRAEFGNDLPVSVDANGCYSLDDLEVFSALDDLGLVTIEQPLRHDDLRDHARLQQQLATPISLDESIKTSHDLEQAIEFGSCRMVNIKAGRVGGLLAARNIHDMCAQAGLPVFCGGMLETGVGRAANVALASLPNFTVPGDLSASGRYFANDLVIPPFELASGGTLRVPTGPGLGVDIDRDLLRKSTVTNRELRR